MPDFDSEDISFRESYCLRYQIHPEVFEATFLKNILYPISKPLSLLALCLRPHTFEHELKHIERIGDATTDEQFTRERNRLIDFTLYQLPTWKKNLGLRISGRKVLDLANRLRVHEPA